MQQASTSGRRNAQDTTGDEHPATLSLDDRLAAGERRSSGSRRDVTQEVSPARAQQVGTQDIAADADAMGRAEQRGRRNSTARNEKALQRRISKLEAALTGEGAEGSSSFNGGEGGEGEGEYTPPPSLVYDASERAFVDVSEGAKERYAELDQQKRSRSLQKLDPSELMRLKKPRQ